MKFLFTTLLINIACISISLAGSLSERIISFDSRILINRDGSMLVTEEIKVHAEGRDIKRGIYRDFPTDYKDEFGNNIKIQFEIKDVLRDGKKEGYHTEYLSNGIRVYFGRSSYFLPPGDYTYTITYKTDRQLGYFDNYDELYWNVTGNGWEFDIENASATVTLPNRINIENVKLFAYTGLKGKKGTDYRSKILSNGEIQFLTRSNLSSKEGLTIVVQWPKGFVHEPDFGERMIYFLEDNKSGITVITGAFILLIFYIIAWIFIGRDPKKGTIIPLYESPANLSPAGVRFINLMRFDNKAFTADIVDLCVKGFAILEEKDGEFTLVKNESKLNMPLSKDEKKILSRLKFSYKNNREVLELKQKNHVTIKNAIKALKKSLQLSYEKHFFLTNKKYFIVGILITIISLLVAGGLGTGDLIFALFWNILWAGGVSVLLYTAFNKWRTALAGKIKGAAIASAIFITLFAIPFVGGQIMGLFFLTQSGSYLLLLGIIILALTNIVFHHLIKAPTLLGRKLMDKIDGFKMYLSVAEQDRLNSIREPEKSPELFEKFLPYAIALDVENEWGKKFESILQKASFEKNAYSPRWYSGLAWNTLGASTMASNIGSNLSSSISSSSTAPGSSSGSSGGFSGGGGGGGGGGGW